MVRGWFCLLLAISSSVGPAYAADPNVDKITFARALHMALEHSPTLAAARGEVEVRTLEASNAFAAFLPQLDLNATTGFRGTRPTTPGSYFANELNLQVSETLYDNHVSLVAYRTASVRREIADLAFRNERDQLTLDLSLAYLKFSHAVSLLDVQDQQFTIINKQFRAVASQFEQGVKTRRDYLRFKTELRRAEIQLETARTEVERTRVDLTRSIGLELNERVRPLDFEPLGVEPASVRAVPTTAPSLARHWRYRIATLRDQIFGNDAYLVRRQYWPRLIVSAGATQHAGDVFGVSETGLPRNQTSWNALLTLNFNLIDCGVRRRNIAVVDAKNAQAKNAIRTDLNGFAADNERMILGLRQSDRNYALARELLDLETKSYAFLESEYRNGRVSYVDIIVGLRDLLNAKVQMYGSYYDLRGALARYRYHDGSLYEAALAN